MGPEAVVFTTHPACLSEDPARQPGFWLGNAVLPRLAQWKDALVAVYNLPDEAWLGFTHAYFPIYAFDEHAITGQWAFARKGDGYLALTAAQGFEQIKRGPDGYRELRSTGRQNIWLCQMGRASEDGSFEDFQLKVQQSRLAFDGLKVSYGGLRGEELTFGWEGPLRINGQEQPLASSMHIEHPYCRAEFPAEVMEIDYQGTILRLNFGK
jgi:hypothetical protein